MIFKLKKIHLLIDCNRPQQQISHVCSSLLCHAKDKKLFTLKRSNLDRSGPTLSVNDITTCMHCVCEIRWQIGSPHFGTGDSDLDRSGIKVINKFQNGAVFLVKWSACSPFNPTIRVRIPLKLTFFSVKICFKEKDTPKRGRGWSIFRTSFSIVFFLNWGIPNHFFVFSKELN